MKRFLLALPFIFLAGCSGDKVKPYEGGLIENLGIYELSQGLRLKVKIKEKSIVSYELISKGAPVFVSGSSESDSNTWALQWDGKDLWMYGTDTDSVFRCSQNKNGIFEEKRIDPFDYKALSKMPDDLLRFGFGKKVYSLERILRERDASEK